MLSILPSPRQRFRNECVQRFAVARKARFEIPVDAVQSVYDPFEPDGAELLALPHRRFHGVLLDAEITGQRRIVGDGGIQQPPEIPVKIGDEPRRRHRLDERAVHRVRAVGVQRRERVAQLVIAPYYKAAFEESEELSDTVRGEGGFGSTGRQ